MRVCSLYCNIFQTQETADAECGWAGGRRPAAALPHLSGIQRAAPHPVSTEGQENISVW